MTDLDELMTWLREQLVDDEQGAKKAARRPNLRPGHRGAHARWSAYVEGGGDGWAIESADGDVSFEAGTEATARHIARHDPATVLSDVAAKRTIVAYAESFLRRAAPMRDEGVPIDPIVVGNANAYRVVLKLLAEAYAGRPGYRKEWRP